MPRKRRGRTILASQNKKYMPNEPKAEPVIAYCVKCKDKREMKGPQEVAMKGKGGVERRAMTGTCPVCGTKMFRIMGKKKEE